MPQSAASLSAVIAAAGSGTRMGGLDKLFTPLAGRPLLAHALAAFEECPAVECVVLVLSPSSLERGREMVEVYGFHKVSSVCLGGPRRQDSVCLGLESLRQGSGQALGHGQWVAIHDGARPLVTPDLILRGLEAAQETGAAVPALPLADTVKEVGAEGLVLRTLDRGRLWVVQTPQIFRYDLLLRAYHEIIADVTDDAAMLEALGLPVKLFPSAASNLKVTTPEDLRLAEALLHLRVRASPS